jgi:Hemerythrin HHE cation binding domain
VSARDELDPRLHVDGPVDFTMMYVAHDAFSRDLRSLVVDGPPRAWSAPELGVWSVFTTQLHVHHHAEDVALWPAVRELDLAAAEVAVLDQMEMEHAQIDPHLEAVDAAVAEDDHRARAEALARLAAGLTAHMRHEENAALSLVATYLGPDGWARFTGYFRETQGVRGAATYFPWLLEGASAETRAAVLSVLPLPARLLYRWRWEPAYERGRADRW